MSAAIVLGTAAVNDVVAWACLAGVVGLARGSIQWRITLLPLYIVLLLAVVRPASRQLLRVVGMNSRQALFHSRTMAG